MRNLYKSFIVPLGILLLILFLSSCSRGGGEDKVIAYVNKAPIFESELKRSLALKAHTDPMFKPTPKIEQEQLELLIDKKLIVQEAIEKGLADQDRFVNTIKTFWEQTLVRDFIEFKKKEFEDYIFVNEEEIAKYYHHLGQRLTFEVVKSKDKGYIDDLYDKIIEKKTSGDVAWETVGPVGYEDITSNALLKVFDSPVGIVNKIEDPPDYYLVMVTNREEVTLKPLSLIRPEIKERVIAMKKRLSFDDWLREQRTKARIKILK